MCTVLRIFKVPGGSQYPDILQEAQTPVYSNANCEGFWPDMLYDGNVCVGVEGSIGSCYVSLHSL